MQSRPTVLVHGGAGAVEPGRRAAHLEGCERAALVGAAVLGKGGAPLEAAEAAVIALEEMPLYNAGVGACLNRDGALELDAAVMRGADLRLGAVTCLPPFLHPISVARAVLEEGAHVFLAGEGAADFAEAHGFCRAAPEDMITDLARERLERRRRGEVGRGWAGGTVGAVVVDGHGQVAAATSTGGTVGKSPGRVGDTPVPGAGTWADDLSGACSATGIGEDILRVGLARNACAAIAAGLEPCIAAQQAIDGMEARIGGSGGLILVDPMGRWGAAFNTEMMSYAVAEPGRLLGSGQ